MSILRNPAPSLRAAAAAILLAALSGCSNSPTTIEAAVGPDVAAAVTACKNSQWTVAAAFERPRDVRSLMQLSTANRTCREASMRLHQLRPLSRSARRAAEGALEMSAAIREMGMALEISSDEPKLSAGASVRGFQRYIAGLQAVELAFPI